MIKRFSSLGKTLNKLFGQVGKNLKKTKKTDQTKKPTTTLPKQEEKKVLMFGWELPPFNSGGLGVACYELANSMSQKNAHITFVLPKKQNISVPFMDVAFAEKTSDIRGKMLSKSVDVKAIDSPLSPYLTERSYQEKRWSNLWSWRQRKKYGNDLVGEVYRYGDAAAKIAKREKFDVIHAHDWLSYPAGMKAKEVSKKPFVAHVHAIEYDRSPAVNPAICKIEKAGLECADKVIAVSQYTKNRIVQYYGIDAGKIEVVHNGIKIEDASKREKSDKTVSLKALKAGGKKIVLFVGRITFQKGVDYLIKAAYKALQVNPKIVFLIVGSGDMERRIISEAAAMGISDKVLFPGFLRNKELDKIYQSADVYVMPSVSEPFGLVALEALSHKVPVIVSKQSGVAEVVQHSLKVDFWDTDELANKIVAVLNYHSLHRSLSNYGFKEAKACTWDAAALKCLQVYNTISANPGFSQG